MNNVGKNILGLLSILLVVFLLIFHYNSQESKTEDGLVFEENPESIKVEPLNIEEELAEVVEIELERIEIHQEGMTILDRFEPPNESMRMEVDVESFAYYLRTLPLKEYGALVLYYDGRTKSNRGIYEAVVNMEISNKDLQQCADAVMRLRGEYLYSKEAYDQIHFNLTNGFRVDYEKWMTGNRVKVDGNNTWWEESAARSNTYESFRNYMEFVFTYAGTLSLSQELLDKDLMDMEIGDVFIKGGSPGHCVIVVDMAEDPLTDQKYYMLAQSYMPAQEIQILSNPSDGSLSPWYVLEEGDVKTPEWTFKSSHLMHFVE